MVYSHWLSPGLGQGPGRIGCMVLRKAFHIAPEQGQGRMGYVHFSGPETVSGSVLLMIFQWLSGVQSWPQT